MTIKQTLRGKQYIFETVPGLFSAERIDPGTRLLIESVEIADGDIIFDYGCGYGVIGLVAASIKTQEGKFIWLMSISGQLNKAGLTHD